jgi:hypothetical protein
MPGLLESGDAENEMSCALGFLATFPEVQARSMGPIYWARGAVHLQFKHPSARVVGLGSLRIAGLEKWGSS